MTSAPRSSEVGEKCALVALAATLMHPGLALAQEPARLLTPQQAEVVEMGQHHRVWSRTELVPDGMGGWCAEERRVIELATGLGRWDEGQQAYVAARAAFEVTESGHLIARETAHQLILPPDLSESAVDMLERYAAGGAWTLRDNAFESVALTNANAAVVNDHNGYLGLGQAQLPGSGGSDQVLSSFIYTNLAVWPSWRFYQVSTDLVDKGSRNATNAGLYHFTTQISQAKETNSVVDIGFHYVAVDTANGLPLDTDGDGLSDYFEDRDGNGTVGSGETDWRGSGDLGLRVLITRPGANGILP